MVDQDTWSEIDTGIKNQYRNQKSLQKSILEGFSDNVNNINNIMNKIPTKNMTITNTLLLAAAKKFKYFSFKYGWLQKGKAIRKKEGHHRRRIANTKC